MDLITGIDLSKTLGGNQNIEEQRVEKTDETIGVSQLLGVTCPGCPPPIVYAYGSYLILHYLLTDVYFRLRSYNKGVVSVAGFSEPSDAEKDDVDLWMPLQSKNSHLTPVQAHYAITHLKECFLFLLEHETNAEPRKSKESDKSSGMN